MSSIFKVIVIPLLLIIQLAACTEKKKKADLSGIVVNLEVQRFDQDLFGIDTTRMTAAIEALQRKYPGFYADFMANILGIPPDDPQTPLALQKFIHDFQPVMQQVSKTFPDMRKYGADVKEMLRYTRYYFPKYPLPQKLITFVGPMDAFYESSLGWSGDIITSSGLGLGLQLHLGKESPFYAESGGQGYPTYISRRFEPDYMVVNCARNIIDDLYPPNTRELALVDIMIDKGKRLYLLDLLLPDEPDSLKIGYTQKQLNACEENEGMIWNLFLQNDLLFETDFHKLKPFITEGPKTQELGEDSPGFIVLFAGKKIVEQFMLKHPEVTAAQLMAYENRQLFEEAKYKPKK